MSIKSGINWFLFTGWGTACVKEYDQLLEKIAVYAPDYSDLFEMVIKSNPIRNL